MSFHPRKIVFGRYGHFPVVRFLAREAERTVKAFKNQDYDLRRNGELRVIRRLRDCGLIGPDAILVDVGAHIGEWTSAALTLVPDARVVCIEMVPETAERLRRSFAGNASVMVEAIALGDRCGETAARVPSCARRASLLTDDGAAESLINVPVKTGDELMRSAKLERIDFLKVDVEGWSLHVLRGFRYALATQAVNAIQFEYNRGNIRTRTFLSDIYEFLEPFGYAIGKIYPLNVDFGPYRLDLEDFRGPNFLALPRDAINRYCAGQPRRTVS